MKKSVGWPTLFAFLFLQFFQYLLRGPVHQTRDQRGAAAPMKEPLGRKTSAISRCLPFGITCPFVFLLHSVFPDFAKDALPRGGPPRGRLVRTSEPKPPLPQPPPPLPLWFLNFVVVARGDTSQGLERELEHPNGNQQRAQ